METDDGSPVLEVDRSGDPIAGVDAERVGEGGLDHHAAVAHQLPWVSLGWSTGAGAVSRPSARASSVWPCAFSVVQTTGNGPLWPTTPGALASASRPATVGGLSPS